jgi:hypothetical protein
MYGNLWYHFHKVSYSNDTTFIRKSNINWLEQSIIDTFKEEGYLYISKPQLPQNSKLLIREFLSSPWKGYPFLCIVGLYPSHFGWTIIKTSIPNLFCQKANNKPEPLLSKLAAKTSRDAFHHLVVQRDWGALLEVCASGNNFFSGYIEPEYLENMNFYTNRVSLPKSGNNFSVLNVPDEFQSAGRSTVSLSEEEKQKREEELEHLFQQGRQEQIQQAWAEWKELNMSDFERMDEDLGKLICQSNSFWHENNLLYKAYTEPKKLEQDGVKLLFFQTGRFDLNPKTEEIWLPITQSKNYGIEIDIPF